MQEWDVETALFNYCADTGPNDFDHLGADDKRQLIVKLRKDVDTVISKTDVLLGVALEEEQERYFIDVCLILKSHLPISSMRERLLVLGVYHGEGAPDEAAIEGEDEEEEQASSGKRRRDHDEWNDDCDDGRRMLDREYEDFEHDEDNRFFHGGARRYEVHSDEDFKHDGIEVLDVLSVRGGDANSGANAASVRSVAPGRGTAPGRGRGRGGRQGSAQTPRGAGEAFEERMFSLAERTLNIIERQQLAEERHYRRGGRGDR
jgi:hypothetical protein